eukprot:NODE_253_length_11722_cov_0.375118.p9 type:complete len:214 gc:universal NODE_253_length_11722_cov_0.375118:2736-3377(+)
MLLLTLVKVFSTFNSRINVYCKSKKWYQFTLDLDGDEVYKKQTGLSLKYKKGNHELREYNKIQIRLDHGTPIHKENTREMSFHIQRNDIFNWTQIYPTTQIEETVSDTSVLKNPILFHGYNCYPVKLFNFKLICKKEDGQNAFKPIEIFSNNFEIHLKNWLVIGKYVNGEEYQIKIKSNNMDIGLAVKYNQNGNLYKSQDIIEGLSCSIDPYD